MRDTGCIGLLMKLIKILILCVITLVSSSCHKLDTEELGEQDDTQIIKLNAEAVKSIGIQTETAEKKIVTFQLPYTGVVKTIPSKSFILMSPVHGAISRVYAEQNDWVTKGQVLLEITSQDVAELQYNLQEKDINLDTDVNQAQVEYDLALANYNREKELYDKGIVALKEIQEVEARLKRALSTLDSLKKQKQALLKAGTAKVNIFGASINDSSGLSKVRAPNDAIVIRRPINPGEVVAQNTLLFELADLSEVFLEANIYQKDLNEVQLHEKVLFTSEVYPDDYLQGVINYISPTIDPVTRTVTVRATIPNQTFKLKPEMFGKIFINMSEKEAFVVSKAALQEVDENNVVYLETEEGYKEVPVTIGRSNKDQVEILEGLQPGDKVVSTGSYWLKSKLHSL